MSAEHSVDTEPSAGGDDYRIAKHEQALGVLDGYLNFYHIPEARRYAPRASLMRLLNDGTEQSLVVMVGDALKGHVPGPALCGFVYGEGQGDDDEGRVPPEARPRTRCPGPGAMREAED